jgi:hypothetical protein
VVARQLLALTARGATAAVAVGPQGKHPDSFLGPLVGMADSRAAAVAAVELDILAGLVVLVETVEMVASESGPRLRVCNQWQLLQHNHQR